MDSFFADVKYNCDVSDARYWGSFSICGLLMRVRDLYRSEMAMDPWDRIPQHEISQWLDEKERTWHELEEAEFRNIRIDGACFAPFDIDGVNEELGRLGLVYGAGYGLYGKPTFLVAELSSKAVEFDHTVYRARKEHVRDIFASAGMSQGKTILLRLWPLKTLLWEKIAEARAKSGSCLQRVLSGRRLLDEHWQESNFQGRFEELSEAYGSFVVAHELAESLEDLPGWSDLLLGVGDRGAEYFLRAIKDILADTSEVGPLRRMIEERDEESLCIFSELFGAYHRKLSPEMNAAMKHFLDDGDWDRLDDERVHAHHRFRAQRDSILETFQSFQNREESIKRVRELICSYTTPAK